MKEAITSSHEAEDYASSAAYAHFLRSRIAHDAGDHKLSVDELRLALATDEGNVYLLTALAEEYARLSELDKAERELRRVIERAPAYAPGQLMMGRILLEAQKFTRARYHLRRAIALRPRDADAYLVLTQLELELNKPDEAEHAVEELASALPGESIGFKKLGLALYERQDFPRAERLLKKAVDRDPGDFELWMALAQVDESTERSAAAADAYAKALELDPDNQDVLLNAGRLALKEGSLTSARAYFDRLLSLSDDPEVVVKVAFSYLATREPQGAVDVLDSARKQSLGEPRISFYAGLLHEKLRHFEQAATAYSEVPRNSELFHEARMRQASCLSLAGQHSHALELFRQGLNEKPDYVLLYPAYARALERSGSPREAELLLARAVNEHAAPEVYEALASTYQRQGRVGEAITLLTNVLAKHPLDESLLFTLGAAYEKRGDVDKSLEEMRQVLKINPDNAAAMNFIGYTLADRGRSRDLEEAEKLVNRALQLHPDSGAFMDSLGWLYFRRGEFARAVDTLEKATSLSPGEPLIIEHLGDAYQGVAKKMEAADAYRRALEAVREVSDPGEARQQRQVLERKLKMLSTEAAGR
jgi:tetratricopeptide (TPR) repeat protein